MIEQKKLGFVYDLEWVDAEGKTIVTDRVVNLIPTEGANHILTTVLAGGTPFANWYIGLFSGNYTPLVSDTAATFPASSTEFTGYSGSNRVAFTPGSVTGGAVDNTSSRAEFTFTADTAVYGGFMTSSAGKGATTGVLISAVRFPATRSPGIGGVLRVTAGLSLLNS